MKESVRDGNVREVQAIEIEEDCFICGSSMTLYTKSPQDVAGIRAEHGLSETDEIEEGSWFAYDGDTVKCSDCGAEAYVSMDCDTAYVTWDEMTAHNSECAKKYEARLEA